MTDFLPPQQVSLNKIDHVEISTVLLPRFANERKMWETCIFYPKTSDVVARYATEAEAIAGHNQIVARLIVEQLQLSHAINDEIING